jgi:hypothetical protein
MHHLREFNHLAQLDVRMPAGYAVTVVEQSFKRSRPTGCRPADQDRGGAESEMANQPLSHNEPAASVEPPKPTARRSFAGQCSGRISPLHDLRTYVMLGRHTRLRLVGSDLLLISVELSSAERQAEPGGDFARKRMKRSTEMTLEKVYDRYRWPSDEIIAGICTLHREMSPGELHAHSMCSCLSHIQGRYPFPEYPDGFVIMAGRVKLWFEEQRRLQSPQHTSHRQ